MQMGRAGGDPPRPGGTGIRKDPSPKAFGAQRPPLSRRYLESFAWNSESRVRPSSVSENLAARSTIEAALSA